MQRRGKMLSRVSPRLHGRLHAVEPISIMNGGCRMSACVDSKFPKFPTFAAPAGPGIVPGHEYAYRTILCNAPTAHPRFYAPCAGDGGTVFCGPFVDIARNLSCHRRSCFGTLAPCCLLSDNAVTTTMMMLPRDRYRDQPQTRAPSPHGHGSVLNPSLLCADSQ